MDLLTINCIWKSKNALRNEVDAKSSVLARGGFGPKLEFAALRGSPVLSPIELIGAKFTVTEPLEQINLG
jgi:hypothetical protein